MYQRSHYYCYIMIGTAVLLMLLNAAIALPNATGRKLLPCFIPTYSRKWVAPCGVALVFLCGPVLPAKATLPFPATTQQHPYDVFQQQMRPVNKLERQLEELEDDRLMQCRDKGSKWEQCFFYGTDTVATNHRGEFLPARPSPMKGGPPTW